MCSIEEELNKLQNISERDKLKILSDIRWMNQDKSHTYSRRRVLLKELKEWAQDFGRMLRRQYKLSLINTNSQSWIYGNDYFNVIVYYNFPSGTHELIFNDEEDFQSVVIRTRGNKIIGYGKTPQETFEILKTNKLI